MSEKLIINNENGPEILMKEIKKMSFIRYSNFLISSIRFILMFFLLFLIGYFPASFRPTIFNMILMLYIILIQSFIVIYFLIVIISGTLQKDFWLRKNDLKCGVYTCICCCCIMSKNIIFLKILSIISTIIGFFWSFFLLHYLIKDFSIPNNGIFFPFSQERTIKKIILYFIDSFLLLGHSYFFHYYQYFLKRREIYIEFYKRLIIKNRNKEAEFVRNELPENNEDSNGTEMQDY